VPAPSITRRFGNLKALFGPSHGHKSEDGRLARSDLRHLKLNGYQVGPAHVHAGISGHGPSTPWNTRGHPRSGSTSPNLRGIWRDGALVYSDSEPTVCYRPWNDSSNSPRAYLADNSRLRGKTRLAKWYAPYSVGNSGLERDQRSMLTDA
jgi:hypothetical protein